MVQAVLAARIDRWPPEEKRLLQTAAVIGIEVPLLQAIADMPEEVLHRSLAHLQAAELLQRNIEAANGQSGTPRPDRRILSQVWLARTLGTLGAFAEGRRRGGEALRLATLEGRGQTPISVRGCLGDLEHAVRVYDQGLALCRASGGRNFLRPIMAGLGYAAALQGRLAEGRAAGGGDQRK